MISASRVRLLLAAGGVVAVAGAVAAVLLLAGRPGGATGALTAG